MPVQKTPRKSKFRPFAVGRDSMDKISAVEGIERSVASHRLFAQFDIQKLPFEQRRRALIAAHAKKT